MIASLLFHNNADLLHISMHIAEHISIPQCYGLLCAARISEISSATDCMIFFLILYMCDHKREQKYPFGNHF